MKTFQQWIEFWDRDKGIETNPHVNVPMYDYSTDPNSEFAKRKKWVANNTNDYRGVDPDEVRTALKGKSYKNVIDYEDIKKQLQANGTSPEEIESILKVTKSSTGNGGLYVGDREEALGLGGNIATNTLPKAYLLGLGLNAKQKPRKIMRGNDVLPEIDPNDIDTITRTRNSDSALNAPHYATEPTEVGKPRNFKQFMNRYNKMFGKQA
jgi:hypothetical protein